MLYKHAERVVVEGKVIMTIFPADCTLRILFTGIKPSTPLIRVVSSI